MSISTIQVGEEVVVIVKPEEDAIVQSWIGIVASVDTAAVRLTVSTYGTVDGDEHPVVSGLKALVIPWSQIVEIDVVEAES